MTPTEKQQSLDILTRRYGEQKEQVTAIDTRLAEYFDGLIAEPQYHNGDELLCAVKLLRLMRTYEVDAEEVQRTLHVFEGDWRQDSNGIWKHLGGGVKQPGRQGAEVYRFEPFQVFVFTAVYGIKAWINTELTTDDRYPTATERINGNRIEDLRRMCVRFICYMPRKTNKTGLAALIGARDFMLGDDDAMIVCCANSQDQSKILFKRLQMLLGSFDPQGKRIRFTATETNWRPGQMRSASAYAMSAGGKTKDGLFASLCLADEYGSAAYTNGNSDMGNLVKVIESSMGPRREGMTFITTTAGNITAGPFVELLEATIKGLLAELKYDTGEEQPTIANDRWMCLLLKPDEWEQEDEVLFTDRNLRRKVNPMLGKIVQHSFYEQAIADSRLDPITKQETVTKLFNVYRTNRVTKWLTGDQIRPRQIDRHIMDCAASEGWKVFCGLDFGGTDDIWASAYLAVNYKQQDPAGRFFADLDLWITEAALQESPNRPLFERWIADGWMHVCPGSVFSHEMAVNMVMYRAGYNELGQLAVDPARQIDIQMFGFDPAHSTQPINHLKAWMQSLGIDPKIIKQMVVPVPQTFVTMNGLVQETEYMLLTEQPWLQLSMNPAWPWMFGNCKLEISPNELKKPLKSGANNKIDGVHALLDALYLFDYVEGQIQV